MVTSIRPLAIPALVAMAPMAIGCALTAEAPAMRRATAGPRIYADLTRYGPEPREVNVRVREPGGGVVVEAPCERDGERLSCQLAGDWTQRPGDYDVEVGYRAVDGRSESATTRVSIRGDELEVELDGYFDADASLRDLRAATVRPAPPGVEIRVTGLPSQPGEPPPMMFVNGSDGPVRVAMQAGVIGSVARVEEDGSLSWVPRVTSGCGTGLGPMDLPPGSSYPVSEIAPIGGVHGLAAGRYVFVVEFDDEQTLPRDAHSIRRVIAEFEITDGVEPSPPWWTSDDIAEGDEPDPYPELARPGDQRPRGQVGARQETAAPLLSDGDIISGRLSVGSPRQVYRLAMGEGDRAFVRVFARCTSTPCGAFFSVMSGRPGDLGGSTELLHREPPAWSTIERPFQSYGGERVLVISCADRCEEGGSEFYGRIRIVRGSTVE